MAKHRTHSVEFKRQVSQEYLAGETLHGLSKRHDISRQLIRVWIEKYQAGELDEDAAAADLLQVSCCRFRGHRDKVFLELESWNATKEVQPGVQARGCSVGEGSGRCGGAGVPRS